MNLNYSMNLSLRKKRLQIGYLRCVYNINFSEILFMMKVNKKKKTLKKHSKRIFSVHNENQLSKTVIKSY